MIYDVQTYVPGKIRVEADSERQACFRARVELRRLGAASQYVTSAAVATWSARPAK